MIKLVTLLDLEETWSLISPWIEKACATSGGRFEAADIFDMVANQEADLFADDHIAIVCRVLQYPRKRMYLIQALGGEGGGHDWDSCQTVLAKMARIRGCEGIEAYGRIGWRIQAKKSGWNHVFSVYEVAL